jgi:hypothetical protein
MEKFRYDDVGKLQHNQWKKYTPPYAIHIHIFIICFDPTGSSSGVTKTEKSNKGKL